MLAVALIAAACGGDEPAPGVASTADVETPTTVDSTNDVASSTEPEDTGASNVTANEGGTAETVDVTDEDMALAFVVCVREAGFEEMPDPTVNADGSVQLIPPGQQQLLGDPDFVEAAEGCVNLIEGATFFAEAPDISDFEDDLLAFAQCLRDDGLDVDDPDLSRFVPGQGARMFGEEFDPQDPANADAIAACQSLLPNAAGN